jgi:WD40 repeat protein
VTSICRILTECDTPPTCSVRCRAGHEDSVEAVGFSRHLNLAATAGIDGKLIVWSCDAFTERGVCQHPEVRPDGCECRTCDDRVQLFTSQSHNVEAVSVEFCTTVHMVLLHMCFSTCQCFRR